MKVFKLEEYLTEYEFNAPFLLGSSDAQSCTLQDILQLSTPETDRLWKELSLGYTEPFGHPLLRDVIASSFYQGLTAPQILCFAGAEEGIFATLSTLCGPQDHAIVLTPCYQSLLEIPLSQGTQVSCISLKEENNWSLQLSEVEKAILPHTKCIVVNFPHNPTGQVIEKDTLVGLIDLCEQHDIWLFSDEVYRLLGCPQDGWAPPAACLYPKAVSLGVMSKSFGMAGIRIGWIACQNKALLQEIKQFKDYLSICNSAPAEILSLIALQNKEYLLNQKNEIVLHNLTLLDLFFKQYSDKFSWVRPQGGCVGFVRFKSPEPIDQFCKRLVDTKGVLLLPGSVYDHPGNYFRIGFGRANMPEALQKFIEFIDESN